MFIFYSVTALFTLFTRKIYYNSVFTVRSKITELWFIFLSLVEAILFDVISTSFAGNNSIAKMVILVIANFVINFVLSLFYYTKHFSFRIIMLMLYQIVLVITELITGSIIIKYFSIFIYNSTYAECVINVVSTILSFLVVCIFNLVWKRKEQHISFSQILATVVTPLCSLLFIFLLPYDEIITFRSDNHIYFTFSILLVLNFMNLYSLNNLLKEKEDQVIIHNKQAQINYQSEKFAQLSNAYKSTKRIAHEIKHRDQYLISCIHNHDYDAVEKELKKGLPLFDDSFIYKTTHNLVIDTFTSSYNALAREKGIIFRVELNIEKDSIPMNDYDLCIVLGNLLDNSFNAAQKWIEINNSSNDFYINCKIFLNNSFFVINVENPSISKKIETKRGSSLTNGFGLENVYSIVEQYKGFYNQQDDKNTFKTTISIPIISKYDE